MCAHAPDPTPTTPADGGGLIDRHAITHIGGLIGDYKAPDSPLKQPEFLQRRLFGKIVPDKLNANQRPLPCGNEIDNSRSELGKIIYLIGFAPF
ncbi:hypothetical protein GCM10011352_27700 [Marinobacterium zhoushanense]|uniref:Uncharacterized protein n=1 Tax=Marinobacterium zhoushanense TaxID=1679163 RepID=A0ABQ1KGZ6_9GAMM|nr:hypothetical protein GCM10011352_27700 [Marinobacterium zhoushanense]